MTLLELAAKLELMYAEHGDVDVTVWEYAGGDDALCDVYPYFDEQYEIVVLHTTQHSSGIMR